MSCELSAMFVPIRKSGFWHLLLALSELMNGINFRRPCDPFVHTPVWGLQVLQVT